MSGIALYPGSFDPVTTGHTNIIRRGLQIFDTVIVAVARNISKNALFSIDERMEMIRDAFADQPNVIVESFEGLLVQYARQREVTCILRGLRAVEDFEYEYQMANMNRKLNSDIDTLFLMADPTTFFLSSRLVKEVATLGGDISGVVPENVRVRLLERVANKS